MFAKTGDGDAFKAAGRNQFFNVVVNSGVNTDFSSDLDAQILVRGNWTMDGTADLTGRNTTVTFNGSGAQTIGGAQPTTFRNLYVDKTAGTLSRSARSALVTNGDVKVVSGTLDLATFTLNRSAAGGEIGVVNGAFLKIGGTNSFPLIYAIHTFQPTSTVDYYGTNQTVTAETYGHLNLSTTGTKTMPATPVDDPGQLHDVGHCVRHRGRGAHGQRQLHAGSGHHVRRSVVQPHRQGQLQQQRHVHGRHEHVHVQRHRHPDDRRLELHDLQQPDHQQPGRRGAERREHHRQRDPHVYVRQCHDGTEPVHRDLVDRQHVSRTSGHVVGNFQKFVATGATALTYEIGDSGAYTPVTVAFGSVSVAGNLTGSTTPGDHPNAGTSPVDRLRSVNRYWTFTNSGVSFTNYNATFNFVAGDLDAGANTSAFIVGKFAGGAWTAPTVGTRTGTSTQITGVTSFSDFYVGESAHITTLGTGADPASTTVAPGGAATTADAFTFQTDGGTDTVTAVTVTLAPGTFSQLVAAPDHRRRRIHRLRVG